MKGYKIIDGSAIHEGQLGALYARSADGHKFFQPDGSDELIDLGEGQPVQSYRLEPTSPNGPRPTVKNFDTEADALAWGDAEVQRWRDGGYKGGVQLLCTGSLVTVYGRE